MTEKTISLSTYYYNKTEVDNLLKSKIINASSTNPIDLNTYITGGFYYCNSDANQASYITPLPVSGKAFFLLVEDWGTSNYTKQTLTHWNSNRTFIRIRTNSGGWGDWEELSKTNHTHGNITSDGKIGSDANKPIITTTNGKLTTGNFGTTANTFCQGNDSRLSNARAPTSHPHGNITNEGKIGSTEGKPIITTTSGTLSAGEFESSTANIKMNGTADVGSLDTFARADHIHPSDTNKSKVSISRSLTSGTKLGTITIDGTAVDLYSTNNTTYSAVTQSANGLMTSADKQKVDKSMMIGFGTASGTTSAFTVSITNVTPLTHGMIIAVYNAVGNNTANATLNVNNLGAKPIYYNASAITASRYPNKTTCLFMYNTTIVSSGCWQMIYSSDTNTTYTAASAIPIMDGIGETGTSNKYAREDHIHPSDDNKSDINHTHINLAETSVIPANSDLNNELYTIEGYYKVKSGESKTLNHRPYENETYGVAARIEVKAYKNGAYYEYVQLYYIYNDNINIYYRRGHKVDVTTSSAVPLTWGNWKKIANFEALSTVATSGLYEDLDHLPSIPTANTIDTNIKMDGVQSAGSLNTYAKADHVHPINIQIPNNADLNDDTYIVPGFYFYPSTSGAANILNYPNVSIKDAFTLLVEKISSSPYNGTKHTLTMYNSNNTNPRTFIRIRKANGTWNDWKELTFTDHTHSYNNLTDKLTLNNTVTSTSTTEVATANAVKIAYDKGNHSHPYISTTAKSVETNNLADSSVTTDKINNDVWIEMNNIAQNHVPSLTYINGQLKYE